MDRIIGKKEKKRKYEIKEEKKPSSGKWVDQNTSERERNRGTGLPGGRCTGGAGGGCSGSPCTTQVAPGGGAGARCTGRAGGEQAPAPRPAAPCRGQAEVVLGPKPTTRRDVVDSPQQQSSLTFSDSDARPAQCSRQIKVYERTVLPLANEVRRTSRLTRQSKV